jgi:hypothetical protein
MTTIARAEPADIGDVLRLLNGAAAWLHARGIDQWPREFTATDVAPEIAMTEIWLARDGDGRAIGTMRLTADADPDLWTLPEAAEGGLYVSRLAIDRAHAGLGAVMLWWAVDYAARLGWKWLRLDARRDNAGLHTYYLDRGWSYLRTVHVAGRFSGALFQIAAATDPAADAAFGPYRRGGCLDPGDRVTVTGRGVGTVSSVYPPGRDSGEAALIGVNSGPAAAPGYRVRLDSGSDILAARQDVTALA